MKRNAFSVVLCTNENMFKHLNIVMMLIIPLCRVDFFPPGLTRNFNTIQTTHFSAGMRKWFFLGSE